MDNAAVWIDVTASDAPASRAFYGELFGWRIETDEQLDYGLVDAGGTFAGGIGQAGAMSPHPVGVVTYVPVDDVDAARHPGRSGGRNGARGAVDAARAGDDGRGRGPGREPGRAVGGAPVMRSSGSAGSRRRDR